MSGAEKFDVLEIRDYYPSINNPSTSTWVYNQVKSLQESGHNPLVISPTPINPLRKVLKSKFRLYDTPSTQIEEYLGTRVIRPPYIKIPKNTLVGFNLWNLSRCIEKYGFYKGIKLIHAHFGQNGYGALALKEKINVPLITSFYGYDSGELAEKFSPYYKQLILKGDLFLALSKDMKKDLLKLGFPEKKIMIHHLGVNTELFIPVSKVKDGKFTFLTVARLDKFKGVHIVIDAFNQLLKKIKAGNNEVELRIVGGGNYEHMLKKQVAELKIVDYVKFINNLILPNSREIVINEMQNCDVFILASYTLNNRIKEGTPVVLMEAQSCGKPCISTTHAGIPEIIIDQMTGEIVPENSVDGILNAMLKLYRSESICSNYSQNSRKNILDNFNHFKQMEELKAIYDRVLY
jgi:colanic acid/amylovoran biosynthesis glycosyltransferase